MSGCCLSNFDSPKDADGHALSQGRMEETRAAPPAGPIAAAGPSASPPPTEVAATEVPAVEVPAAAVATAADTAEQAAVEQRRRQARMLAAQMSLAQQQVRAGSSYQPKLAPVAPQEEELVDSESEDEEEAQFPIDIATVS